MSVTVQWKPEVNALTTPRSWRPRHVPHTVLGDRELAAEAKRAEQYRGSRAVRAARVLSPPRNFHQTLIAA